MSKPGQPLTPQQAEEKIMNPVLGASIFPTDAVTTVTGGITSAITDNIGVVLGLIAFTAGLKFVLHLFQKHAKVRA